MKYSKRLKPFLLGALAILSLQSLSAECSSKECSDLKDAPKKFFVGIGTHMGKQFANGNDELVITRIQESGAQFMRDEIYWKDVEKTKGKLEVPAYADEMIDDCIKLGIEPLIVLGYGNRFYDDGDYPISDEGRAAYIRYALFLAEHFKGKVKYFEVWNEWDMGLGLNNRKTPDGKRVRGDAQEYVKLVGATYAAMKESYPELTILAGGHAMFSLHEGPPPANPKNTWEQMQGWFDEALSYGLIQKCDGLSMHTYTKSVENPEHWIGWMNELQKRISDNYNQGKPVPFYITETGWFTHSVADIDHTVQGDYIARLYLLARTLPAIKGIWYFNLGSDVFGISHGSGSPRPAYWSLKDISKLVTYADYLGRLDVGNPDIWILRFQMPDGSEKWAAWSDSKLGYRNNRYNSPVTGYYRVGLQRNSDDTPPLKVKIVGMGSFTQPWGQRKQRFGDMNPMIAELTLGPRPQIISGELSSIKVTSITPTEIPDEVKSELIDKEGINQGVGVE